MGIWLVMKTSNGEERPFRVSESITIGRETRCQVRIAVPNVESRHCQLTVKDGVLRLADLGSENGTYHNGTRVREAILNHADTLTVGPVTFEVRIEAIMKQSSRNDPNSRDGSISEPKPIAEPKTDRKTSDLRRQ